MGSSTSDFTRTFQKHLDDGRKGATLHCDHPQWKICQWQFHRQGNEPELPRTLSSDVAFRSAGARSHLPVRTVSVFEPFA
jgi:hypothetical protein